MERMNCTSCGVLLSVPPGATIARCPKCYATIVCPKNNGYIVPAANQYNGYTQNYPNYYSTGYYHPPPQSSPQPLQLPVYGTKKALLIGISYHGHQKNVQGSVRDVRSMTNLLVNRLGFPKPICLGPHRYLFLSLSFSNTHIHKNTSHIKWFQYFNFLFDNKHYQCAEEEMNSYQMPTKQNIRNALSWLIQGCQSGSSLVFYYTGHSSQVPDNNGDELDGYDESLCPVDYLTEGNILDDEINATIVRPLPRGAKLHAIIDTCKSGTFLDLPFMCRMNQQGYYAWDDQRSAVYKGTRGGTAICFSACDDHQISLDIKIATGNTTGGCMTNSFIQAMENEYGLTYACLLHSIRTKIWESQKRLYPRPPTSQVPQLSSSEKFDIHSNIITI
ncbi:Metacaspase-1 [Camellia lanceoleosa]|uniref:Metacaspase-1 n=1 Tax=Camellia lanceoleosa TaxID=1840588 RepID=A0ACC0IUG1_9ERIC|nr:Metacaspase-1 [Camellia lanceoleosa]